MEFNSDITSHPSEYRHLDVGRGKRRLAKLAKFLVFVAGIAGIVIAFNRVPVLSDFLSRYSHWWGEAFLVATIAFYLILQRRYSQPRTKVVVSNDPLLVPMRDLVKDDKENKDSETHLYADCAVLSRNIYQEDDGQPIPYLQFIGNEEPTDKVTNQTFVKNDKRIETDWELIERIGTVGEKKLLIEVHKHAHKNVYNQGECVTYAIVFRGTVGLNSWIANAHWLFKWLPFEDQYDQIKYIVPEIVDRIAARHPNGEPYNIITTGHSLGGGLAQHACYISEEIKTAYVFNSTPVTGYTDFAAWQRLLHMQDVRIHRLYERGEVLEALRFFMKIVYLFNPAPNENPYLSEHRFDFKDAGFINEHGMLPLAIGLCFLRDFPEHKFEVEEEEEKIQAEALKKARKKKKEAMAKLNKVRQSAQVEAA